MALAANRRTLHTDSPCVPTSTIYQCDEIYKDLSQSLDKVQTVPDPRMKANEMCRFLTPAFFFTALSFFAPIYGGVVPHLVF